MTELRLAKLFAWTIGVLVLLWMLAECLGGPDETRPGSQDLQRESERYAADCERTWEALELAAGADHQTVDRVIDQIDALGTGIEDSNLKALAEGYARQAQEIVAEVPAGDEDGLDEARVEFMDAATLDLAMRCPVV